ncbi:hypothetical protein J3R73_001999 [Labrys monachus]|uniref:DUF3320 domain-containing protein n=2 Tax=Labrys monachus TaxID=217067 RepID=A0ABU0FD05_9HYPH|nr:hypothetical protein [Labrys monachus]
MEEGGGVFRRHADTRLQTRLTSEGLQKRLFDIWYDAAALEEEQGVNGLFLAIGLLRWFEDDRSDVARHAPLILLPVRLQRSGASDRFTLRRRDEPASLNLSIQAKLRDEFGLAVEGFTDEDDIDVAAYLGKVAAVVAGKARWKVLPDAMMLGLFSFSRYLMYRDLDPAAWPAGNPLHEHPLLAALLGEGFDRQAPIIGDRGPIDAIIPPAALNHVVDADASQAVAIEEVLRGRHLVIKGPPGTGKSQTITNIIAGAVLQGKKVLFVAEKAAALEAVQRRLRHAGLGRLTLELHSAKAGKRAVLEDLRRTRDIAGRPTPQDLSLIEALGDAQAGLNSHAAMLHEALQPTGLTAYQLLGHLLRVQDGGGLPGYDLPGAERWTGRESRVRFDLAADLARLVEKIGDPDSHMWRGVGREALDPGERDRLVSLLQNVEADLETVGRSAAAVSRDYSVDVVRIGDFETLARSVKATFALPPQADRTALAGAVWRTNAPAIAELIVLGRSYRKFSDAMALVYRPQAWRFNMRMLRNEIAAHNASWTRFLKGPYREAMEQFRSLLAIDMPADRAKQISLLDGMISAQEARRRFEAQRHLGAEAFGTLWQEERSDWDSLQAIVDWWRENRQVASSDNLAVRLAVRPAVKERGTPAGSLAQSVPRLHADLGQLQQFLGLDIKRAFGVEQWADLEVAQLTSRLRLWLAGVEALAQWVAFGARCKAAQEAGLAGLVEALRDGRIAGHLFVPTFERTYYEVLRGDFFERLPELKRFDGELQDLMVESFRVLDHGRIALAGEMVATRHLQARPPSGGGAGALGVLDGELAKKSGHLPIRQLLDKAGSTIQQLKPVLMMSPLSVSHFLKPGALAFDLLVIDEASQIEAVSVLGAIARAGQLVVVGDERQLPPTRFFARLTGDWEEHDEEEGSAFQGRDAESILDLCLAKGMAFHTLDWHYRSRHESLVVVPNREFYGGRLMAMPNPTRESPDLGFVFHHLPQARYDRGNTRTNPQEARAVAEAVIAHARNHSERRAAQSLGVVTFSVAQRQAILRELELLRRAHPDTEAFFNSESIDPFFVKNLENAQGDERDVIFISIGYGRTAEGYLAMSFGALNLEGGERRLNVLISRARYRCEVFSSITAEDVDADRTSARGVAALKTFLDFAQNGRLAPAGGAGREPPLLFEEQVAAQLRARGHAVATRVGGAGFHVDLAVVDPDQPGRYILGIECDGAQYNAARSTRDRDRLHQQVLEELGWIVHRIWSVDWYQRPQEELAKVEASIIKARLAWQQRDDDRASPSVTLEPISAVAPRPSDDVVRQEAFVPAVPDPFAPNLPAPDPFGPDPLAPAVAGPATDEPSPAEPERAETGPASPAAGIGPGEDVGPTGKGPAEKVADPTPPWFKLHTFGPLASAANRTDGAAVAPFPVFQPIEPKRIEPVPPVVRPSVSRPPQAPPSQTLPPQPPSVQPPSVQAPPVQPPSVQAPPVQAPPVQAPPVQAFPASPLPRQPLPAGPVPAEAAPAERGPAEVEDWEFTAGVVPARSSADDAEDIDAGAADAGSLDIEETDELQPVNGDFSVPEQRHGAARPAEMRSSLSHPYVEAVLRVSGRHELQELSAARMAVYVAEVVQVEGPVHEQEIIARIRGAFGLGRAGVRVREAVLDGIDAARIMGRISGGPFYTLPGQAITARDRSQTTSPGLRKLDMLPPQEIEAAFVTVIKSNRGAPRDALLVAVSRLLGFAATSAPLRERLEEVLDAMLARKELAQRNNLVVAVQ